MKLLLDTHALLWWEAEDPRLSRRAARAISDRSNEILVSAVSAWEITLKSRRLKLKAEPEEWFEDVFARNHFISLPMTIPHAVGTRSLGAIHGDPFDRLLVSQALAEGATLVTRDRELGKYGAKTFW